jgi:hypothetical protein
VEPHVGGKRFVRADRSRRQPAARLLACVDLLPLALAFYCPPFSLLVMSWEDRAIRYVRRNRSTSGRSAKQTVVKARIDIDGNSHW